MALDKQIKHIQQQKLTRKEFLTQIAAVGLAVVGVNSIMHALSNISRSHGGSGATSDLPNGQAAQPDGYGDMPYGGD